MRRLPSLPSNLARPILGPPLVALCAVLVYWRAPRNGLALDDAAIFAHPLIQSVRTLGAAMAAPWWFATNHLYRPLTLFTLGVDRALGGGAAWWPHAVNVALHAIVAVLVTRLAGRFLPAFPALAAGLLFALLPVHAEAVSTLVGRAELLSAAALVAGMLVVTREAAPSTRARLLVGALAAAALASKEAGAAAPFLTLAAAFAWPAQRPHAWRWAFAAAVGTVVLLVARLAVLGTFGGDIPHPFFRGMEATTRLSVALSMLPRTAAMLLFPVRPAIEDVPSLAAAQSPDVIFVVFGFAMVVCALLLLVQHFRRPTAMTLGACIVAATLAPTSNLIFAEGAWTGRTLYAPSVGAMLVLGWIITQLQRTRFGSLVPFALGAICARAATITWREVPVWRNTSSVVATMIVRHPDNFRGHAYLAYAARDSGHIVKAHQHFGDAIDRFPADPELLTDAATVALRLRDTTSATRWLNTAVQVSPRAARARTRLYGIMRARGDTSGARAVLLDGLRLEPEQRSWSELLRHSASDSLAARTTAP